MKKMPYRESNYETIIMNDYYYVDKTMYIEKLEKMGERKIMYLRPRKFGKLYYLGYLIIKNKELGELDFGAPNEIIRKFYTEYFLEYIKRETELTERIDTTQIAREILLEGKIDTAIETLGGYLKNLSNRDYQRFDEKYIKVIFYSICKTLNAVKVKSEYEVEGKYIDILLTPKEEKETRKSIMIEFKYIKKEDYDKNNNMLKEKQEEAKKQIIEYKNTEEMRQIADLNCYTVVVVKDEIYVEKI